jgi:nitronate monooxygenase
MGKWPNQQVSDLFKIAAPIIQAPMAGSAFSALAIAVSNAGALGSLACPLLTPDQIRKEIANFRAHASGPLNLNFFCHQEIPSSPQIDTDWLKALTPYYLENNLDPEKKVSAPTRYPFNEETCQIVEEFKPEVVSFHFGLPELNLLNRVKATGAKVISSATTVQEAIWLEAHGCDAIIAQGAEAGGHRGMFLSLDISTQMGTMALVPQIVDAVKVPVIAAGGISDARGVLAAFALGASAVQMGTMFLFTNEAAISKVHQKVLLSDRAQETALTNLFTGRPARGVMNRLMREIGPMSKLAPPFPHAGSALIPLKDKTLPEGSSDYIALWSGQAAGLNKKIQPAAVVTTNLIQELKTKLLIDN